MLKAKWSGNAVQLKLVSPKPEPDLIPRDSEAVDRILESGFSYVRYLSIDCVGGERASERKRFSVSLMNGVSKTELYLFLRSVLGTIPLSEALERENGICGALMDAQDKGLIRLREIK